MSSASSSRFFYSLFKPVSRLTLMLAMTTTASMAGTMWPQGSGLQLYGHRGARGLAPENSIPGYAKALEIGVDMVDMDVVMTRDHVVVVHHDLALNPDIDRDQTGQWVMEGRFIHQMTLSELKAYDIGRIRPGSQYATWFPAQQPIDGTPVPTLEEVIDYVMAHGGPTVGFQIEIKDDPEHPEWAHPPQAIAQAVADILHKKNIVSRTEVQAFNWQCLLELQKIDPAIQTAYLTDTSSEVHMLDPDPAIAGRWTGGYLLKDYGYSIPAMVKALGGRLWDPQDVTLTGKTLQEAHRLGLKVVTWSDPETSGKDTDVVMARKLFAMGVDGIITDRPDEIRQFRQSDEWAASRAPAFR